MEAVAVAPPTSQEVHQLRDDPSQAEISSSAIRTVTYVAHESDAAQNSELIDTRAA